MAVVETVISESGVAEMTLVDVLVVTATDVLVNVVDVVVVVVL